MEKVSFSDFNTSSEDFKKIEAIWKYFVSQQTEEWKPQIDPLDKLWFSVVSGSSGKSRYDSVL